MPATCDHHGIRFEYPENWKIDTSGDDADNAQVVVSSPQTAFWQLSKHPPEADLESLCDEALSALRSEYKQIEVEPDPDCIEAHDLPGFSVNFFYLDLTNTCWLRGIETPGATYLVLCQAEDREFQQAVLVFRAMLASVLRNLG